METNLIAGKFRLIFKHIKRQPVAVILGILQGCGHILGGNHLADLGRVAAKQQRRRADMPAADEHGTQAAGVIGIDTIQRVTRFIAAIVEIRRAIMIIGSPGIKRMRDMEIHAGDMHVIGPPLHLGVGQVLAAGAENLHHRQVVGFAEDMGNRAGQFGCLP